MNPAQIQFLSKTPIAPYGTTVMRCAQPAAYLRERGWTVSIGCIYRRLPSATKAIVFHRAARDAHTSAYMDYAKASGLVLLYDIDDFLFGPELSGDSEQRHREAMRSCDVVLASTEFLAARVREFHSDVRVIRNGLSKEFVERVRGIARIGRGRDGMVTLAYLSGSRTHDLDFQIIEEPLVRTLASIPTVRLLVIGKVKFSEQLRRFGERFEYREFMPYREFQKVFSEIDINLVPLRTTDPFAQGRSELKYIEAGAWGIPTIAGPTATYQAIIQDGVNGALSGDNEWYEAIKRMAQDADYRRRLGAEARRDVARRYGPECMADEWDTLLKDILAAYGPAARRRYRPYSTPTRYARCCSKLVQRSIYRGKRSLLETSRNGRLN